MKIQLWRRMPTSEKDLSVKRTRSLLRALRKFGLPIEFTQYNPSEMKDGCQILVWTKEVDGGLTLGTMTFGTDIFGSPLGDDVDLNTSYWVERVVADDLTPELVAFYWMMVMEMERRIKR